MIDHRAVQRAVEGKEILDVIEKNGEFTVRCKDYEKTFKKSEFLQMNCMTCTHHNPVIYDEIVAEPVEKEPVQGFCNTN